MSRVDCVSEADLRALLLGELSEPVSRSIALHLESCAICESAARRLDDLTDPFVHALRQVFGQMVSQDAGAAPTQPEMASPPFSAPRWVADYRLLGELGRGGMSVVYKARQSHPDRVVALKMILAGPHTQPERRARFLAEADAIARLQHPQIVQIHEAGQHDGLPFLSLEFMEGGSLAQRLGGLPQPPREAAALLEGLARAVEYAHSRGVIHRDLKPANVLLTDRGQPKLADFGLAKYADAGLTLSGAILGTPAYMAPEQAAGDNRAVGPAADIYALGAILYELLTGRPPFRGATPLDTLEQTLSQEPVPPDQLQGKLPRDLSTICLKCLQKEPARRYASAGELAEDLRRFQADRPIRARPSSWRERVWRWCRRNQHVAMLLLVIGLLMVGGMVGATVAAIRFERLARSESMAHRTADRMAEAERIARDRADRHASEARAVVDFLITEMLAAARPDSKLGRTTTVDEVLARTGRAIEGQFADQPLVEAAIRHQIASAYHTLSMGRRAAEHAERARDLRARNLGPEHPLTLESALLVVQGLHNISAFGTALGLAETVYKARLRTLGPDHPDTAFALYWVASCINNDPARFEEARCMFSTAIDVCRRKLLANDPRLTFAMAGLACTLANQKRYAESLALNDELLEIYRRLWGPEHVEVALTLNRKADVLAGSGRREEAVQNCEEALRMLGRVQDPGYIEAYHVMGHLLDLHTNEVGREYLLGNRAKAERLIDAKILPLCDQRVARAEAWLARDARDPDARVSLVMYLAERGAFGAGSGRRAEALKDTDRALALGESVLFPAETTGGHRAGAGLAPDTTGLGPASDRRSWDNGALPLYKIAQVYALLATSCRDDVPQSTQYADRAIQLLRQAIVLGFRRKQLILASPGFPALRSRADFRAILESLPPRVEGATEGEALGILETSVPFEIAPQTLPEKRYVGRWSGDAILIGRPRQVGEWVDLALPVPADGTYRVVAYLVAAPGHGMLRISLDGESQGFLFDGFRPGADPRSFALAEATPPAINHDLGTFHLRKGTAALRIEAVGKNERSSGFSWGLDCVVLQRSSDPSTHDVDVVHPKGTSSNDAKY